MRLSLIVAPTALIFISLSSLLLADYKDDLDHTLLRDRLGERLPSGNEISVSQIEAPQTTSGWVPDENNPEFTGKTFSFRSGTSNPSSHATRVGRYLYGSTTSQATDIATIDSWEAGDWVGSGKLRTGSRFNPRIESRSIQNSSWVGSGGDSPEILRRLDFLIHRDGIISVVGLNNGSGSSIPELFAAGYHTITVGRTDGNHSRGRTSLDNVGATGRTKPEIVVPLTLTSYAVPVVGSTAALLLEVIHGDTDLANAADPRVMKALLLAGATKDDLPSPWNKTSTDPLDPIYGAGELNTFNSYYLLQSKEHESSSSSLVSSTGWDLGEMVTESSSQYYYFDIPEGEAAIHFSAILTWHRQLTSSVIEGIRTFSFTLPNLDLRLYPADGFSVSGSAVQESISDKDNIEHLYLPTLAPGSYVMEVSSNTGDIDYGLAWISWKALTSLGPVTIDLDLPKRLATLSFQDSLQIPSARFIVEGSPDLTPSSWSVGDNALSTLSAPDPSYRYQFTTPLSDLEAFFWRIRAYQP